MAGNFRVLIVDDDEIAVAAISSVLAEVGCEVIQTNSPLGVTQLILAQDIDVVLMDLHMPALPGDKLAAMLRENKRLSHIPVIIVSAASADELRRITDSIEGVVAVSKRRIYRELPAVVRELALRKRGAVQVASTLDCYVAEAGETSVPPAPIQSVRPLEPDAGERLRRALPLRAVEMTRLWREASCGSSNAHKALSQKLALTRSECEAIDPSGPLTSLVVALDETVRPSRLGTSPSPTLSAAALAAFNLLARLSRAPANVRHEDVLPVVSRLVESRSPTSALAEAAAPHPQDVQDAGSTRVLLIEKHRLAPTLMKEELEVFGFDLVCAASLDEGVQRLQSDAKIAAVLLDRSTREPITADDVNRLRAYRQSRLPIVLRSSDQLRGNEQLQGLEKLKVEVGADGKHHGGERLLRLVSLLRTLCRRSS